MEDAIKVERSGSDVIVTMNEDGRSVSFSFSSIVTIKGVSKGRLTVSPTVKGEALTPLEIHVSFSDSREAYVRQIIGAYGKKYPDPTLHISIAFREYQQFVRKEEANKVIILADVVPKKPTYLVEPFVEKGVPNILYAPGGLGKTTLAYRIVGSVISGLPMFGWTIDPNDVGDVLVMDWENSEDISSMILHKVFNDIPGMTPETRRRVYYVSLLLPLADIAEQMAEVVSTKNIKLIVIDSGTPAVGGAPEAADMVSLLYTAIRSIGVTSLIIAHVSKADVEMKSAIGSVFWMNFARNGYSIEEVRKLAPTSTLIKMKHRKRNSGPLHEDIYYTMTAGEASVSFVKQEKVVQPTAKEIIIDLLREHGELTRAEMKRLCELSPSTIRTTTNRMSDNGEAKSNDKGNTWKLI